MRVGNIWDSIRDFILLCGLLAAVNWLQARTDFGWMQVNPTPWLLPAVLLGARYGFATGLNMGIASAGLVAFVKWRLADTGELTDVLHENAYTFLSIALSGAVAGELRVLIRRHTIRLNRDNETLHAQNERLHSQLEVVRETRHQLQTQLALYNAPLACLDTELEKLFESTPEHFQNELLRCLHRLTGLTSAGFYWVTHTHLQQTAVLHPTAPLASTLTIAATPLAKMALDAKALASVADATQLTVEQPFLAALPWTDELGRDGVLLIQDMPLDAFDMHHLARVELILKWTSEMARLRHSLDALVVREGTVSVDDFRGLLYEATSAALVHGLPSAMLHLDALNTDTTSNALKLLPATAVTARTDGANKLAVLLPFSSMMEARELTHKLSAALPMLSIENYLIINPVATDEIWKRIAQN